MLSEKGCVECFNFACTLIDCEQGTCYLQE